MCKVSEWVGLMALVVLAAQGGQLATDRKLLAFRLMSEALLVSLLVGAGFFGLGKAAEPWLPHWQHVYEEPDSKAEHDEHEHAADQARH